MCVVRQPSVKRIYDDDDRQDVGTLRECDQCGGLKVVKLCSYGGTSCSLV